MTDESWKIVTMAGEQLQLWQVDNYYGWRMGTSIAWGKTIEEQWLDDAR